MHFWKFWNCLNKKRAISKISKIMRVIYTKNCPNQTCDYWLITPNQQTLCIETDIFLTSGNYKSTSGQLQNNTVNGAMSIAINCNTISLSCHEQVCLMRLCFERYFSWNVASLNILVHGMINLLYYEHWTDKWK